MRNVVKIAFYDANYTFQIEEKFDKISYFYIFDETGKFVHSFCKDTLGNYLNQYIKPYGIKNLTQEELNYVLMMEKLGVINED